MTVEGTPAPRSLRPSDFDAVRGLLGACALPTSDLEPDRLADFLGIFADGRLLASGGLEVRGREALLRSLVAHPSVRGRGFGSLLVAGLEARARRLGVRDLYLLTEDAGAYFERLGYRRARRADAPEAIAHTAQFAALCSGSAALLHKRLTPSVPEARYAHTNLIARDWRALAHFYENVFGCTPVPPERHFAGAALEAGTGIAGAALEGAHLRLPGLGPQGPTLEIFEYRDVAPGPTPAVNRPGFAHIAFAVADVESAQQAVLAAGGRAVGEIVALTLTSGASVTWCYVTDPEGNIIELQAWA
jgi:glyoxylase I family protein